MLFFFQQIMREWMFYVRADVSDDTSLLLQSLSQQVIISDPCDLAQAARLEINSGNQHFFSRCIRNYFSISGFVYLSLGGVQWLACFPNTFSTSSSHVPQRVCMFSPCFGGFVWVLQFPPSFQIHVLSCTCYHTIISPKTCNISNLTVVCVGVIALRSTGILTYRLMPRVS